jgi:signal transduction histidine kinase
MRSTWSSRRSPRPAPDQVEAVRATVAAVQTSEVDARVVAANADHLVAGLIERVERSRELERATARQLNLAKTQFLSRMSHELRTPLNVVLGFAQLLQLEARTDGDREGLAHIERAGRHLLGLIDEVLDISRIEEGRLDLELEQVPVAGAVEEVLSLVRPLADQRGITIDETAAASSSLAVCADPRRLRQILFNVVQNAVKYNVQGGRIEVRAHRSSDGFVRIAVRDTGPGVPPDALDRIFVPFERASEADVEGTGLGLPISLRLARAMRGRIDVDSRPGSGSTFTVALPETAASADGDAATTVRWARTSRRAGSRRGALHRGQRGQRAARRARARRSRRRPAHRPDRPAGPRAGAGPIRPALVLLDLHLPDGRGTDVLAALRADAELSDVPIVVVSSDAMPGRRAGCSTPEPRST